MFDRDGFIEYVGDKSGGSYSTGLKYIEIVYAISIDEEYDKDKCAILLDQLEQDKKSDSLNKTELKRRSDMASHLKKYVEYRSNIDIIKQRKDFVIWMQTQPRCDDASKYYSDKTINAAADKLQSGLRSLGVRKYTDINCFTILDSKPFEELYNNCYAAAEVLDKKQGHRDFRNGLEFYMQFLNEQNGTVDSNKVVYCPSLEDYTLTITADAVVSTDPNFTMDNLGLGDDFKPLDAWFEDANGNKIKRNRAKNERKISNQTLPRLAFQIYESQLSALSPQEKAEYPTCQYEPNGKIYKGIYPTVEEFRKQLNSIEYLVYICEDDSQFVIYAWNIFSTILFVKECLKRFGTVGDRFVLTYCNKADGDSDGSPDEETIFSTVNNHSLNTILYGPPGTGKTYNSVNYAVAIIEGKNIDVIATENHADVLKRYYDYKEQGLIAFTTFHQSYGYEEFIEGIKPIVSYDNKSDGKKDIQYEIMPGTFKRFCEKADPKVKSFDDAWDELVECAMSQDSKFAFTRRTNSTLNAELKDENTFIVTWSGGTFNTLKKDRVYEQWIANTYEENTNLRGGKIWMLEAIQAVIDVMVKQFGLPSNSVAPTEKKNHVFIIDEINRGNISKIFGELITLIEDTKRIGKAEETTAILPYSGKPFGVPDNVYILGTMNTADRSIAQIDTALRRRFSFVEMMPDIKVLEGIEVEGINIANMLDIINRRIEVLYDREHTIGHALFTGLRAEPTIEKLAIIFKKSIIPLLQEYFYEDYKKIRLVLGDNRKNEKDQFIIEKPHDYAALFGDVNVGLDDGFSYEINQEAFRKKEAYRLI